MITTPENLMHGIATELRNVRLSNKLSLRELALLTRTDLDMLCRLEWSMEPDVDVLLLCILAQCMRVDVNDLLRIKLKKVEVLHNDALANLKVRCDEMRARAEFMTFRARKMRRDARNRLEILKTSQRQQQFVEAPNLVT